jgi:hypothetical protein
MATGFVLEPGSEYKKPEVAISFLKGLVELCEKHGVVEIEMNKDSGGWERSPSNIAIIFSDYSVPDINLGSCSYVEWIKKQLEELKGTKNETSI